MNQPDPSPLCQYEGVGTLETNGVARFSCPTEPRQVLQTNPATRQTVMMHDDERGARLPN